MSKNGGKLTSTVDLFSGYQSLLRLRKLRLAVTLIAGKKLQRITLTQKSEHSPPTGVVAGVVDKNTKNLYFPFNNSRRLAILAVTTVNANL